MGIAVIHSLARPVSLAIATGAGVGFLPLAPGTFGSLLGVLLFFPLSKLGLPVYVVLLVLLSLLGIWASSRAEEHFDRPDDGRIVIDEVVGQLITLTPLIPLSLFSVTLGDLGIGNPGNGDSGTALPAGLDVFSLLVVTGFVAFRLFDIWKPGMVGWAERKLSGGLGVMADDLLAGGLGAVLLAVPVIAVLRIASQLEGAV
jgi:phosphatidylglycerophosphatase A